MLEWAGVLTWQNRIMRSQERRTDLFGCVSWRWRVIRTSNASVFRDLLHGSDSVLSCKAENRSGTRNQEILEPILAPAPDPRQPARTCLSPISALHSAAHPIDLGPVLMRRLALLRL